MKARIFTLSIMALAILFSISGCKKKEKKVAEEGPMPVEVAYPAVDSVTLHKSFPGYISSNAKAKVVARASGTLLSKNYQDGQYVTKGQVLFTIETTKYKDAVTQASASLSSAKSQYDYAKQHYEAMKKAYAANAVSAIALKQAETDMEQAAASIKNAEASLADARLNMSYCTVRAPISGRITTSTMDAGSYVDGGMSPVELCTIYDDSSMAACFSLGEAEYNSIIASQGMNQEYYRNVPLHFNDGLKGSYTANLNYTAPEVDKSTGTIVLRGKVNNDSKELKEGMYVSIDLPYGVEPKALLVNNASIGSDQLGKYLYVVNDSNKVVYTPVKTGEIVNDTLCLIESGIDAKSRYVTKAILTVRNGETVKPILPGAMK